VRKENLRAVQCHHIIIIRIELTKTTASPDCSPIKKKKSTGRRDGVSTVAKRGI
jgi:hypothetical protein